jgi:hypothetical protein
MSEMFQIVKLISAVVLGAVAAQASPFWVTWDEGWPEEQGWSHSTSGPPAQRWLDDGLMYVDTRAQFGTYDMYWQVPASLIPGPEETFVMEWRTLVYECTPASDVGVLARTEDQYTVGLLMNADSIGSEYEPGNWTSFAPGVFHDFTVESSDCRHYVLYIDGVLSLQGSFFESLFPGPEVVWGNFGGCKSLTAWDHVAYGIVPEPSAAICLLIGLCRLPARPSGRADFGRPGTRLSKQYE